MAERALPPPVPTPAFDLDHPLELTLRTLGDGASSDAERAAAVQRAAELLRHAAREAQLADVPPFVRALESLRMLSSTADPALDGLDVRELIAAVLVEAQASPADHPLRAYISATALLYRTSRPELEASALELLEHCEGSPRAHRAFGFARASEVARGAGEFERAARWLARARAELDALDVAGDDRELRGTRAFVELHLAALHTALGQADEAIVACELAQRWLDSAKPWPEARAQPELFRFARTGDLLLLNRLGTLLATSRFDALSRAIADHGQVAAEYQAQVDVYEAHALHARGELARAAELLERALQQPLLAAQPTALAQLELALVRWDAGARDEARATLAAARAHLERNPKVVLPAIRMRALEVAFARDGATTPQAQLEGLAAARGAWDDLLRAWDQTPLDGSGVGFLGFPQRRLMLGQLIELELAVDPGPAGLRAAFEHLLEAQRRGTSSRRMNAPRVTLDDVRRELLGPGRGLIVYLPSWRGSHAFAVDSELVVHVALPPHEDLGDELNDALAELREGRATQRLDALSPRLLPAPLADRVRRWESLAFVGADLLRQLPIEALLLDGTTRLGLAKGVYWLPSIPAAVALARRPSSTGRAGLRWIGAPHVDPRIARRQQLGVVALDDDARVRIQRAFTSAEFFESSEATVDRLHGAPRVLALYAHGVCDATRPHPNGIALAPRDARDDGVLDFEDVTAQLAGECAPDLVLLLACGAAKTIHKVGDDGSDQLGAAFLEGGVRCVAASAEPLHQGATAQLAAAFLEQLARGSTPALAMRDARRELARDARFAHPKFWSTLQLSGLADR